MEGQNSRIILDNGSGYLKCGLSNQNIPQFTIPALVGRPMLRYEENIDQFKIKVPIYEFNNSLLWLAMK